MKEYIDWYNIKNMRPALFFFIGIIVMLAGCASPDSETANWVEVRGTLTKQSYGKTSSTEFEYEFNGTTYNGPSVGGSAITAYKTVLGESYMLKVNPKEPRQYIIMPWRVGFNAGEPIDSCIGKIKKVGEARPFGKVLRLLEFEYVAYGRMYKRRQRISPYDSVYFPELKDGQCYPVIFWVPNPQRAVMFFNRPMVRCE